MVKLTMQFGKVKVSVSVTTSLVLAVVMMLL